MFEDIAKNLEAAAKSTHSAAATRLSGETRSQIDRNFKSKTTLGSVKTYDLKWSSLVTVKPSFLSAFSEGKTIRGKSTLIILLPDGERLGFKRVSASNSWASVWQKIKNRARIVGVGDGLVVVYSRGGRNYAIYKFQKQVTVPKLVSLTATASTIAESIPNEINKLMDEYE